MSDDVWHQPGSAGATHWMSQRLLRIVFLAFFVVFFVVGIALTVLGFLDYGSQGGPSSRAFRILGVVALLLCIGFLIAACVIVSECITSSIKRGAISVDDDDPTYGYRALYPTSSETLANSTSFTVDRGTVTPGNDDSVIISNANTAKKRYSQQADPVPGAPLGLCPSCSCQLIARPVGMRSNNFAVSQSKSYPNGIVQFEKKRDMAVIQLKSDEPFQKRMLPPAPSNASDSGSAISEEEDEVLENARNWV